MFLKLNMKQLIISEAIPLAAGGLSSLISRNAISDFANVSKPPLSPPAWIFPIVWTVLYILMGFSDYLVKVSRTQNDSINKARAIYFFQLALNFFWPIIFFNAGNYLFAFIWLAVLWLAVFMNTILFYRISKTAGYLLIPYILWVAFAGYLNLGIYTLNG
ncbi:MAG: tryptophan-rich sensory protein [Firmicutes bacterium]|nr:tryptophan-rich sensory protein [Bacillota bacterium]